MQPLSGGGEVRAESVVQRGKHGSGDQSPVTSPASQEQSDQPQPAQLTCVLAEGGGDQQEEHWQEHSQSHHQRSWELYWTCPTD